MRWKPRPLSLDVKRHNLANALKLRVASGALTTLLSPDGDALTAVDLKVQVVEKGTLRLRLPKDSSLFNVLVNDEGVSLVREGDAWLFHVFPAPEGDRPASVRFVYSAGSGKGLKLEGPALDVPLENLTWRVLVPEGRVVISGLNPASLWGLRQQRARMFRRFGMGELFLPQAAEPIGHWRLRDWLRLLSFELEYAQFGCYRPALESARWLGHFRWMDAAGARWWPIFGAVYFLVASKRVRGMRLLEPGWKNRTARAPAPAAIANRQPTSSKSSTPSAS
jgi:hypothetical protein